MPSDQMAETETGAVVQWAEAVSGPHGTELQAAPAVQGHTWRFHVDSLAASRASEDFVGGMTLAFLCLANSSL